MHFDFGRLPVPGDRVCWRPRDSCGVHLRGLIFGHGLQRLEALQDSVMYEPIGSLKKLSSMSLFDHAGFDLKCEAGATGRVTPRAEKGRRLRKGVLFDRAWSEGDMS